MSLPRPLLDIPLFLVAIVGAACATGGPESGGTPPVVDAAVTCTPSCVGRECGPNGCGGECGKCVAAAPVCTANWKCVPACAKQCDGRICGPDGCGTTCGTCPNKSVCSLDQKACAPERVSCAGIGPVGCCQGSSKNAFGFSDGTCGSFDCAAGAEMDVILKKVARPYCGWDGKLYNCVDKPGLTDPSGKYSVVCPPE